MATQWENVCAATAWQGEVRGLARNLCYKSQKAANKWIFCQPQKGQEQRVCLFVCATKYFCAAIAHKRESESGKFSNFPEGNCHHASWLDSSLCHPPLSALYLFCLCKQTRTSVNSSRSAHKHLTFTRNSCQNYSQNMASIQVHIYTIYIYILRIYSLHISVYIYLPFLPHTFPIS